MSWRMLSAVGVLALVVTGCASRDGLRVEGTAAPATAPTASPPVAVETERVAGIGPVAATSLDAAELRALLLTDPAVNANTKTLLRRCADKCLSRGPVTDLIPGASPQRIVSVNFAADGLVFAGFLVGDVDGRAKVLSMIRGDGLDFSVGKDRQLVAESNVYAPGDPLCCPSGIKVEVYLWNGSQLVRINGKVVGKGSQQRGQ